MTPPTCFCHCPLLSWGIKKIIKERKKKERKKVTALDEKEKKKSENRKRGGWGQKVADWAF